MNTAPYNWAKTPERHAAEIDQHCYALERVADHLEDEGLYEATLVRASVASIRESCMALNDAAKSREMDDASM